MKKVKLLLALLAFLIIVPTGIAMAKNATLINLITGDRKPVKINSEDAQKLFADDYILETSYGYVENDDDMLGFSVISDYYVYLSQSMSATQTTVPVTSMETTDGHTITMADLGEKVFLTIDADDEDYKEIVMCESISGTSWGDCSRGLSFYGTSTAAVTANQKTHNSGAIVVMSNVHQIFEEFMDKDSDETIGGNKTFTGTIDFDNLPTSTTTAPTSNSELTNKKYVDDTITAGAPDGTESVKGINELATQAEMAAGTAQGSTATNLVLQSQYASSTPDGITVPITESDGDLNAGFISQDSNYTWSGNNTFSGDDTFSGDTEINNLTIDGSQSVANKIVKQYIAGETIAERDICMLKDITEEYDTGTNDKNIANVSAVTYVSQGFQIPTDTKIFKGSLYIKKNGTPSVDLKIAIYSDNGGDASSSLVYVDIDKDIITTSFAKTTFYIDAGLSLTADTQYHLVFSNADNSVDASDYYILESNTTGTYAYGNTKNSQDASSWSDDGSKDIKFKIYYTGLMKADNDDDDVNTGVRIVVADEAITTRTLGNVILEGEKDGFAFDRYDTTAGNIFSYGSSDGTCCSLSNTRYAYLTFVNNLGYLHLDMVTVYLYRDDVYDGTYTLYLYRTDANGDITGSSLCSKSSSANLTTSHAGTAVSMNCNVDIKSGEQLAIKVYTTQSVGVLRISSSSGSLSSLGNIYGYTTSYKWLLSKAKMTITGSILNDFPIGKFLYTSTTAGGYAKTGKYAIGMILDEDTLQIGKKPGMEYIGTTNCNSPGGQHGHRNWVKVPIDTETIIVDIDLNTEYSQSNKTITLTRSGNTSQIYRDGSQYSSSEQFMQATLIWTNDYISVNSDYYSTNYLDQFNFYFYK